MSGEAPSDDMAALGKVVEALKGFTVPDQERIIRSARTMLGLPVAPHVGGDGEHPPARETQQHLPGRDLGRSPDIKAFIDSKRPTSDTQFAATVAYYHQFEAPETQRKTTIDAEDLQDAARKSNRGRFSTTSGSCSNSSGLPFPLATLARCLGTTGTTCTHTSSCLMGRILHRMMPHCSGRSAR
jgi:hypothetical protein